MINFARQAYANPYLFAVSAPFGGVNPLTLGQQMGGFVPTAFGYLPIAQLGQYNPLAAQGLGTVPGINPLGINPGVNPMAAQFGQYNPLLSQIGAGINPLTAQFGQANPFVSQFGGGFNPAVNPFIAQSATNWPGATHFSQQGIGGRTGAYGIDPRVALGQQFGFTDPNVVLGLINPALAGDPMGSLMSQQTNPLVHQQLPIRPLINAPQAGFQSNVSGIGSAAQWPVAQLDPYRAFIEAQLISQLATNPLYQLQSQLQRGYGVPEALGFGAGFGTGPQFNPLYGNPPFCG